jgi:hypothetical protein
MMNALKISIISNMLLLIGLISTFSSWGLGADLDIKPEISAPGGQIFST